MQNILQICFVSEVFLIKKRALSSLLSYWRNRHKDKAESCPLLACVQGVHSSCGQARQYPTRCLPFGWQDLTPHVICWFPPCASATSWDEESVWDLRPGTVMCLGQWLTR